MGVSDCQFNGLSGFVQMKGFDYKSILIFLLTLVDCFLFR